MAATIDLRCGNTRGSTGSTGSWEVATATPSIADHHGFAKFAAVSTNSAGPDADAAAAAAAAICHRWFESEAS